MGNQEHNNGVPQGWALTSVGNIYDIVGGGTPSTQQSEFWEGDIPWITSADIHGVKSIEPRKYITQQAISDSATNLVPKNSLIVVTRVGLGKIAIAPYPLCFSQDSQALIDISNCIFPNYSLYYLSKEIQRFKYENRGTTISGVTKNQLKEVSFLLPPLPEQHRIVTKIEELFSRLDAGVDALEKVKTLLKMYRQSVLKAAVEGRLTAEWREKHKHELEPAPELLKRILKERRSRWETEQLEQYKAKGKVPKDSKWKEKYQEPELPDTSGLPKLPEGWVWCSLPLIGELNRGKSKHRPRNDSKLYGGIYPFIQTGDVRNANGVIKVYSQTYNEEGLKQSRLWEKGTLCITIAANIADTAILGFDSCFPDSIVGFVSDQGVCIIEYIEFFLRNAKENLERYAPATAQKNINLQILSELAVPLPSEKEQRVIVNEVDRRISVADKIDEELLFNQQMASRLRQSILKHAFSGKLVPQDPTDEPAEKLLERIKTEKAKSKPMKKKAKGKKA